MHFFIVALNSYVYIYYLFMYLYFCTQPCCNACHIVKSLTCGAVGFIVLAALSIKQAAVVTLADVTSVVVDTTSSPAAGC